MRKITIILCLIAWLGAYALNPLDHNTLLNDNDQRVERQAPDDEEDPYFLLSGEADKAIAEGDYITAIMRIKDALRIAPDNPSNVMLLSNLGIVYGYLEQDSLALKAYNDALAMAPAMTTIQLNRGLLRLKTGDNAGAVDDFSAVIARDSTNVTARYYRGMMALYGRDLETATHDFNVLETTAPDDRNTLSAMATYLTLTGNDKAAIPYYKRLLEVDESPEYYSALASCLLATDDLSEASAVIGKGLAAYPDDADLYYCRAWLNKKYFRPDDARADGQRAIDLGADPAMVNRLLSTKY